MLSKCVRVIRPCTAELNQKYECERTSIFIMISGCERDNVNELEYPGYCVRQTRARTISSAGGALASQLYGSIFHKRACIYARDAEWAQHPPLHRCVLCLWRIAVCSVGTLIFIRAPASRSHHGTMIRAPTLDTNTKHTRTSSNSIENSFGEHWAAAKLQFCNLMQKRLSGRWHEYRHFTGIQTVIIQIIAISLFVYLVALRR